MCTKEGTMIGASHEADNYESCSAKDWIGMSKHMNMAWCKTLYYVFYEYSKTHILKEKPKTWK